MYEGLEPRRLMSISLDPATGNLTIIGTNNADSLEFSEEYVPVSNKHVLRLHVNGKQIDYKWAAVKSMTIQTLGGNDTVILGSIPMGARIEGGDGDDILSAGDGKDSIFGGNGNDYCFGRDNHDYIEGGPGYDMLLGGNGNDRILPFSDSKGDDTVSGGSGNDTVDFSKAPAAVIVFIGGNVDKHLESEKVGGDFETFIGSPFADRITNSTSNSMHILGGAGNDTIVGGTGRDTIEGGPGNDSLSGAGGDDVLIA
jgi:Ca2+-binding RTX toxin-like protein